MEIMNLNSAFIQNILEQPEALQRTLESLQNSQPLTGFSKRIGKGNTYRQVVLTGMGSSYHALHPLFLRLTAEGIPTQAVETSELIHYAPALIKRGTLLVAVSQSGESVEIVELLHLTRGVTEVIGVTNTSASTLAHQADALVLTQAGEEAAVSCKTYLTALAALTWLGDQFTNNTCPAQFPQLTGAPQAAADYLHDWQAHVHQLSILLSGIGNLFLVGRGPSLAGVGCGALILKESAHFPAEGMSSAAFRHGPLESISPQVFVMVFKGLDRTAALNTRLLADVLAAGGQAASVEMDSHTGPFYLPQAPAAVLPILEVLPVQMAALALAQLQGFEAGRFTRISKVTTTE
jgi:glucosamine--fructose-6-phosphate aminotransferase (isomerizing)